MTASAAPLPLVGRVPELASLSAALDAAANGRGSTQFIVGEGGIGKTRLISAAIGCPAARGFTIATGRAFSVEAGVPYAVFADAFLPVLRSLAPAALQVLTRGGSAELATLFPALSPTAPVRGPSELEIKPRLFDVFAGLLHRLAERTPLLIVLENLHWADPSSIELLHFLARGATTHRIAIFGSYDDTRRDANPALRTTEQSLRSLGVAHVQTLDPLTRDEAQELVRTHFDVSNAAIAPFVARLHERTRGNPYFIEETIKSLLASGQLREEGGAWTGWSVETVALPSTIRDAVGARLDRLSPDARWIATIAAAVGSQALHALLASISAIPEENLLATIDELRAERVLSETESDGKLAYDFTHPLLREVLYAGLSRARARSLHAEIGSELERLHGERAHAHADTLAWHFLSADATAEAARACPYLVAAGRSALDRGANREAADVLEAALRVVDVDPALSGLREKVLDLLARARQRLGDFSGASLLWERALALAAARSDDAHCARLHWRLGIAAYWTGRYCDAIAHYDRGLAAATGDHPRVATLLLARGAVFVEIGRADSAATDMQSALVMAEQLADNGLLARVHHAFQLLAIWRGPSEAAREHGKQSLAFAMAAGDKNAAWNAEWALAANAGLTGDAPGLAAHHAKALALAEELRSPVLRAWADEMAIEYHTVHGEWDAAIELADRTIADARAFSQNTLLPRLLVWSSLIRFGRGELEIGEAQMEEAWALSGAAGATSAAHVNVHAVVPAHVSRATWHLARREFEDALAIAEAGIVIADRTGYVSWAVHRLVPIACEAALYLRNFDRAIHHGTRLRTDAERLGHRLGLAWAEGCFAVIRLLQGDPAGAIPMLRNAAEALEAIPIVDYATRVRRVLADAYYESGDTESAVQELRRIHGTFARLGAIPALDHVREKFRQLGVRPPARSSAEGIGALTAREVEIARLVAARKTNKEIAAALDISSRTVGTHLSNVFGKLGVDSRGALTDLVREGALEKQT